MDKNISVIIPSLGRPTLKECLLSLIKQSLKPKEVILIDTSFNKKAKKIINFDNYPFDIKYFNLKGASSSTARNFGIKKSSFDYLAFLDDDCMAKDDWLEKIFYCFKKNKSLIVKGENKIKSQSSFLSKIGYIKDETFFKSFFYKKNSKIYSYFLDSKNFIAHKNLFLKNKIFFDDKIIQVEDLDFSLKLKQKKIKILYCDKAIIYHIKKTTFLELLKKEYRKAVGLKKVNNKWRHIFKKKIFFNHFLISKKAEEKRKRLIKLFLERENVFFKIVFYLTDFLLNSWRSFLLLIFQ
jgi:glycosyltransferase involved in cell wall biosynthesis